MTLPLARSTTYPAPQSAPHPNSAIGTWPAKLGPCFTASDMTVRYCRNGRCAPAKSGGTGGPEKLSLGKSLNLSSVKFSVVAGFQSASEPEGAGPEVSFGVSVGSAPLPLVASTDAGCRSAGASAPFKSSRVTPSGLRGRPERRTVRRSPALARWWNFLPSGGLSLQHQF
jgi:hypothetical protein